MAAMTTAQVMERLNVKDPDTVYAAVRQGRLPACRIGRTYRFDSDTVDAFLRGELASPKRRAKNRRRQRAESQQSGSWRQGVKRVIRR